MENGNTPEKREKCIQIALHAGWFTRIWGFCGQEGMERDFSLNPFLCVARPSRWSWSYSRGNGAEILNYVCRAETDQNTETAGLTS